MLELPRESFAQLIERRGWATTPRIVDADTIRALRAELAPLRADGRGGVRHLLDNPLVSALARSQSVREVAAAVLGPECFAVRAIFFDKTPGANWKVAWHQDLTIATRRHADVPGFAPWTEKGGVPHVQPPVEVLEHLLAVRVHLDACGIDNGPVRVIDGSHRRGRLSATAIEELRAAEFVDCLVEEGGVLAFRPLILHASSPATMPAHRRVIHIEFAAVDLPSPLEWHRREVPC